MGNLPEPTWQEVSMASVHHHAFDLSDMSAVNMFDLRRMVQLTSCVLIFDEGNLDHCTTAKGSISDTKVGSVICSTACQRLVFGMFAELSELGKLTDPILLRLGQLLERATDCPCMQFANNTSSCLANHEVASYG
jgi:hypothetical protein